MIPEKLTGLQLEVFSKCSGFNGSLKLPSNYHSSIPAYAFYKYSGFTGSLTIPENVTFI